MTSPVQHQDLLPAGSLAGVALVGFIWAFVSKRHGKINEEKIMSNACMYLSLVFVRTNGAFR